MRGTYTQTEKDTHTKRERETHTSEVHKTDTHTHTERSYPPPPFFVFRSTVVDIGGCILRYFSLMESMAAGNEVSTFVVNALC